jgi:HprK-related kinase A
MARIGDLPLRRMERTLADAGLALDFGGVRVRIRSSVASLAARLRVVYGAFPFEDRPTGFFDVAGVLEPVPGWRGMLRDEIRFVVDGEAPFDPLPAALDLPMVEWGLNWYIAHRNNHRLMLHSGVVERGGHGLLLPALPGSGKSTLTAALASRGWRLLSDEFAPINPEDGRIVPLLRPVGLKNESIDIIRRAAPHAVLGPEFPGTHKGTVAHLAPDARSVASRHVAVAPFAVVFPKFERGAEPSLTPVPGGFAFVKLAGNSFNYSVLGPLGFTSLKRLVQSVPCYRITYATLDQAVEAVEDLHRDLVAPPRRPALGRSDSKLLNSDLIAPAEAPG